MESRISGRVVDEDGAPHVGLVIAIERADVDPHMRVAQATTDDDGRYVLSLGAWAIDAPARALVMVAYDALGLRRVASWPMRPLHDAAEVALPRARVDGWWATGRGGEAPMRLSDGNAVEMLVDDQAFKAVADAVAGARSRVLLSQLLFEPNFALGPRSARAPALVETFVEAARRGVDVRLLMNCNVVVKDSCAHLERLAEEVALPNFEVRRYPMTPNVMHAKFLLVDDREVFLVGPPFQQRYWDTSRHLRREPARGDFPPTHDVSVRVRGPFVAHAHELFAELWARQDADPPVTPLPPITPPPAAGTTRLQLTATLPPDLVRGAPDGEGTILESYLRAIARARDFVYLETQYFTSPTVAEALARALRRSPSLQVILVLNADTDVPTYIAWQKRRLSEMGFPETPRLGVFVLRTQTPLYVHSKVAIVDDCWATFGSANLDSMSLETADEFGTPLDPNVDANIALVEGVDGAPSRGIIAGFRRRLWTEHFGDDAWAAAERPAEGWLAMWRAKGAENARRVAEGELPASRVFDYALKQGSHGERRAQALTRRRNPS